MHKSVESGRAISFLLLPQRERKARGDVEMSCPLVVDTWIFRAAWDHGLFCLFLLSDVKPSNVLINALGQVKMCDFGISGYLVDSVAKTIDAGCKPYMAVSTAVGGGIWKCSCQQSSPGNRTWMATWGKWKCAYGARNILLLIIFFLNIFCLKSLVTCFKHIIFKNSRKRGLLLGGKKPCKSSVRPTRNCHTVLQGSVVLFVEDRAVTRI